MKKSWKTVANYPAALLVAVVLHAGLFAGLGGLFDSGIEDAESTKKELQQDAMVVSFVQPQPIELRSEPPEPVSRLSDPPPSPEIEALPEDDDPIPEPPEDMPSEPTAAVQAPESPIPEQAAQSALRPLPVPEHSKVRKQVHASVKIEKPRPLQPIDAEAAYPLGSRLRGEEGAVRLVVRIGADGRIDDLEIRESSGFSALDKAARRALRRTRFAPATRNDQAVPGELSILIRFALDS